ncbi:uncharacterized protein [Ptychodera flava]|uniref:uncharacterized protein n=1 Tax=Ptychodera flava TaxID=63121 RepID=UPI00396A1B9F
MSGLHDMTCQIMTSDCLLQPDCDNELHVCRANSKLQTIIEESTPCYGRTTGTSDNCGVMEIVFDHSAITESETLAVLCKDLGEYLKEELRQFPECSAVNCEIQPDSQRLSSRDRRQDIEPLTVKIEVEIKPPSVKSSSTNNYMLDLMAAIETILQEGIDNGELPGDLGAVQEVFLIVDGGWSEPHRLTPCNVTCGGLGRQKFIRNCTNPPPSNGGADCEGRGEGSRPCFKECTTAAPTVKPNTEGNVWMKLVVLSITAVLILLIAILLLYVRRWNQKKKADRAAQHAEENAFNGIGRLTVRNTRDLADRLSITPSEMASFDNAGYNYQDGTSTGHLGAVVAWPDHSDGTAPSENIYATIR